MNSAKAKGGMSAALWLFALGVFMGALDNGIMSSALTTITTSFHVTATWGAWSITIYTLALAISVPLMAKLSDRFGRKRFFLIGVAVFGIGSLGVALSGNFTVFLLARLLQGFGGGGIFPIANGYITSTFPKERQGAALGMVGGMNGIASILGPNIGSFILGATNDWHWLFWINVPIALLLVIFGTMYIKENRTAKPGSFDIFGAVILSGSIFSIMYGLTKLQGGTFVQGLEKPSFLLLMVIGIVLFALLLLYERNLWRKGHDPIIPIQLLARNYIRFTLLVGFGSGLILASVIFLPGFNQMVLGFSVSAAGYLYTPMTIASGVGAVFGGRIMDKRGPVFTLLLGLTSALIGAGLFPLFVHNLWEMIIASALLGLGVGVTLAAPLNFLMTTNAEGFESSSLGLLSLIRQIGMTIGPVLYADFLSASLTNVKAQIVTNLQKVNFPISQIPSSEFAKMQNVAGGMGGANLSSINQIPVPQVRTAILDAIHTTAQAGFGDIYGATAVVAALAIFALIFIRGYKHDLKTKSHSAS
nr:MFS transporter [Bacilli bacterium]